MKDKQLKKIWQELSFLGCNKVMTEKIFFKIVRDVCTQAKKKSN